MEGGRTLLAEDVFSLLYFKMGNLSSHSALVNPLETLLCSKGIRVSKSTLIDFLGCIDFFAPWFAHTGQITLSSWEKLGRDFRRTADDPKEPDLNPMVLPLWGLVRACLKEEGAMGSHGLALEAARNVLEEVRSHSSDAARDLIHFKETGCRTSLSAPDSGPSPASSDSEEEDDDDPESPPPSYVLPRGKQKAATANAFPLVPTAPPGDLVPNCQFGDIAPPGGGLTKDIWHAHTPAPPWPSVAPPPSGRQFHKQIWRQLRNNLPTPAQAFPVLGLGTREVQHEPLDMAVLKQLKAAVHDYGPTAPFTLSLLESVGQSVLTPSDWAQLARACLSPGGFLMWQSMNAECCHDQADDNAEDGHPTWNADMLLGRGPYQADQTQFPRQVYRQISNCAQRAWRQASNPGDTTSHLTKIIQGPTEPFADFVARIFEAASRIFPTEVDVQPLVKQIIFKQANKECKTILRQYRHKSVDSWLKYCRDTGGPLTNAGLAALLATTLHPTQNNRGGQNYKLARPPISSGLCFQCHQPGHRKRDCPTLTSGYLPARSADTEPCRRCRKGPHKAEECRSAFDVDGNPLTNNKQGTKNGQRGPPVPARGPQMGAYSQVPPPPLLTPHPAPLQAVPPAAPQAWTSVPQPLSS